ncbi:hypothetical protein K469DRAFT_725321 [Zopfia rhizophila CBS 207.26]|uniref:Extracellular membrane protein CFEM domain-containing protein n=1 Tax=Zopfia rhizophila CBS 207.26 TaxID=1314779 RepID=A0A6A6E5P4_9PEZI|nr:hypothetical protein K469DRAFT_725321 [Zopfia rhizophila CBS 207.26]
MRYFITLAGLVALVSAVPQAPTITPVPTITIADPTISVIASTSLNVLTTSFPVVPTGLTPINGTSTSRRKKSHWEPIPIFSKSCDCPAISKGNYPCWATDPVQSCLFEENHSWVCWTSANFGCPSPTRELPTPSPCKNHAKPNLSASATRFPPPPRLVGQGQLSLSLVIVPCCKAVAPGVQRRRTGNKIWIHF